MSIKAYKAVWEHSKQSGGALVVLLALADHANDDGYCWPGVERIARYANIKERQVQRHIRTLEDAGEIETRQGDGRGNTNVYYIKLLEKGVMDDTLCTQERVSSMTPFNQERVSSKAIKGVIDDTLTVINQEEEVQPQPDPVIELAGHFTNTSGLFPKNGSYQDEWELPLTVILNSAGDLETAKGKISAAIELARGKGFRLASPRSITNIIANMPAGAVAPNGAIKVRGI